MLLKMPSVDDLLPALRGPAAFRTTHWSVVLSAAQADRGESRQALEQLCRNYWCPLYMYVRRRGYDAEEAKDLTQGFFARLLERDDLGSVEPRHGRFRSFLLACLNHWLANEWDRRRAEKRGSGRVTISLDDSAAEDAYRYEPADPVTPEVLFERRWARTLLERVLQRLRQEYAAAEKTELFEELKGFLSEKKAGGRSEIAARHGIGMNAVDVAIHRLRKHYAELLREEVAHTVSAPHEIEPEIRCLIAVVAEAAAAV